MQFARRLRGEATVRVGAHRIAFPLRDFYIGPTLYLYRVWEPHLIGLLPAWELPGKVAIDVGACLGNYTLALSGLVGKEGRVISIEPGAEQLGYLHRNLRANGASNVTVLELAVGASGQKRTFVPDANNVGGGRIGEAAGTVEMVTLDSITAGLPERSVGFIKIDVEAHEHEVLSGMRETLRRNPDVIVQLEISAAARGGQPAEVVRLLESLGLRGWEVEWQRLLPILEPRYYEAPFFRDLTDVIVSRNPEDLERRLRAALEQKS
jgi:FkbM family methyltransferase